MFYTDDPVQDFLRFDAERESRLSKRPKCDACREGIQTDECYEIDGKLLCPYCMDSAYRVWTDDYIEE